MLAATVGVLHTSRTHPVRVLRQLLLLLLSSLAAAFDKLVVPDPRNFQAQYNGQAPLPASLDHLNPPLPVVPDDLSVANIPLRAMMPLLNAPVPQPTPLLRGGRRDDDSDGT
jgi:hypothetical protein